MPSPTTVLDIITTAMKHIGAIASAEVPNANEANDGLAALNDVLETWSLQKLAVYGGDVESFTTIPGQAEYTIGTTGGWVTTRPVQNITQAYCTVQGVDFPIGIWTEAEYNSVAVKQTQSQIIDRLAYINDFPNGIVKLFPTPQAAVSVSLSISRVLVNATAVGQTLTLPPGYSRALAYAVAVELTPQYGGSIDVSGQAKSTLAYIKRANRVPPIASFDSTILGPVGAIWQRGW